VCFLLHTFVFSSQVAWNVQVHVSGPVAWATRKLSKSVSKKAMPIATIKAEAQLDHTAQVEKFMKDINWTHCFLPTLTQALYTLFSSFTHFMMQSSQFLQTVQAVFDLTSDENPVVVSCKECSRADPGDFCSRAIL